MFYVTDMLQIVEALVGLGYGGDPRLANALALIRDKQDAQGRWPLEYDYAGKTWVRLRAEEAAQQVGHAAHAARVGAWFPRPGRGDHAPTDQ